MDDSQKLVDREMAQARLLMGIFSRSVHRQVVLKGGLAIRSLYNSPRYTKDIDLGQDPSSSLASLQQIASKNPRSSGRGGSRHEYYIE